MARDALRAELSGLKLSALRRRALADGVGEDALDLASDGDDAKAAVVELVLAMADTGGGGGGGPSTPQAANTTASTTALRLATALRLEPQPSHAAAAEREKVYRELQAVARSDDIELARTVALACMAPLAETALAADESVVGAAEFQRAYEVLAELNAVDPVGTGEEYFGKGHVRAVWGSPGNAYVAAVAREASELSRMDAQTIAFAHACDALFHATGADQGSAGS
jgi:hypothetical protein